MDKMKIQENLVWDKHTGDLIGFVDLGGTEVNCATLQKTDQIAIHVLVFLVHSIVNPMKFLMQILLLQMLLYFAKLLVF